jgi:hypothetical protein
MRRAWLLALLTMTACGGGASTGAAKSPPPAGSAEPTIDGTGKKSEGTLEPVDVRAGKAQVSFDEAETAFTAAGNDCAQLCKALGSMSRATERLCELAKESGDDKRCTDATTRLETAKTKVKSSCGVCE